MDILKTEEIEDFGWRAFIVGVILGLLCGFFLGVTFVYTFG